MEYTEEFLKKIVGVGTLGYTISKIINVLDIEEKDEAKFIEDMDNPESKVAIAFQKGIDKADYAIDMKLFEKAKEGDLKALEKYEHRKNSQMEKENKARQSRQWKKQYDKPKN